MKNIQTIADLRKHYAEFSGFMGNWYVLLENFEEAQGFGLKIAVSKPLQTGSWLTQQFKGLPSKEVEIGENMSIIVLTNWDLLVRQVHADALRERLLVMITGNLFGGDFEKAVRFSGRSDGNIRRSLVGVPVGQPYWYPTAEQLASVN